MKVLVLGGTRYAGIHLVRELLSKDYDVTIATRGKTPDDFGDSLKRKTIERQSSDSLRTAFTGEFYDVVIDNLAYSSNDIRILLNTVTTSRYVMTSTVSVYYDFHMNMNETEMDTHNTPLKWCEHDEYAYDEVKRQAESALFQAHAALPSVAVRFPWIFGKDDYTNRLFFYIEHVFYQKAMNIDNPSARLSFVNSLEAGHFLSWCVENPILGAVNASSFGTVSLSELIEYTEKRTGKMALIHEHGDPAPLNGVPSFSINTEKAQNAGYHFKSISEWVYSLIDDWVDILSSKNNFFKI